MRALQIDRKLAKFAAARIAGSFAPGRGARFGPLELVDVDAPHVARPGLGSDQAPPVGHLRQRPVDHRWGSKPLLRSDRQLPLRPWSRGRRRRGERPGGDRSRAHCATRGIDPACRSMRRGANQSSASASRLGTSNRACSPASAPTPAVAGRRQWWPTSRRSLRSPTICPTRPPCSSSRWPARSTPRRATTGRTPWSWAPAPSACSPSRRSPPPATRTAQGRSSSPLATPIRSRSPSNSAPIVVCDSSSYPDGFARLSKSLAVNDQLTCGFDHVVDCIGSSESIDQALKVVAPGGDISLVGMPGKVSVDLTGLWHREVAIRGCYAYQRPDFDTAIEVDSQVRSRPTRFGHLSPFRLPRCDRARRQRGPPRCGEGRFRHAPGEETLMPRPGFVLDVDRSTPPTLFWRGEGFSLEKLPADRSRIIYPPEPLKGIPDVDGAIRHALLNPHDSDPLPALLFPGMKLTIAFDDASACRCRRCASPTTASGSSRRCSTWRPRPASMTST